MTSATSETPPGSKFCSSCGRRLEPQDRFCDGCGARQIKNNNPRGQFSELLKVEGKLALREPYGLFGVVFPVVLLVLFGWISSQVPGNVANTGLTVLDLYIPTIMVIGFISIAISSLPNRLVRDREIGWLRRVSTTPVPPSRLLGAQLILNLVFALAMVLIVIFGGEMMFGAPLIVGIPFFVLSIILSIAEIFSLGLVVAAIAPSQTVANALSGALFFLLLFLSGLWVQPALVGGPLQTIMYYSPSGAATRALLYSVFNAAPPYTTLVTMIAYTVIFAVIAIRYFRWE
jgi:ABC-2 type transport system permease protein